MFTKKKNQAKSRNFSPRQRPGPISFSYSSSRKTSNSNGAANKEEKSRRGLGLVEKLQYSLAFLVIIAGLVYLSSLSSDAQLRVDGQKSFPRGQNEYLTAAKSQLSSSFLNRSKLSLNRAKLEQDLKAQFPEIRGIEVKTGLFRHRPLIIVQLSRPTARLVTPTAVYVLDEEGYALFEAKSQPTDYNLEGLVPIEDNSGHNIQIGKPALTQDQIAYVKEIIGQFKAKSIKIKSMTLESGGLDLHVHLADDNYFIKFSFLNDARISCGSYFAIRDNKVMPRQYVDVRVPERAYIK